MTITFICTGNICRSPFAEAVLRKMLAERGIEGVTVNSAGTERLNGESRDTTMVKIAREMGYDMGGNAVHISELPLDQSDIILTMDNYQSVKLTRVLPYSDWSKIHTLSAYSLGTAEEIPDPFFQTEYVYRSAAAQIERMCSAIADNLAKQQEN